MPTSELMALRKNWDTPMSTPWLRAICVAGFSSLLLSGLAAQPSQDATSLRFEVTLAPGLLKEPQDGRVLVAISRNLKAEPRLAIGPYATGTAPVLGADGRGLAAGKTVVLDQKSALFPLTHLGR